MAVTMIHSSAKPGTVPGAHNMQLHYLVREKTGVVYNIIRQKHNVPAGHACLTRPDITALGRAQHCEAVFKRKNKPNEFYFGDYVSRTVWAGAGIPPTPPLPDIVHVHHHHETTIYRDQPNSGGGNDGAHNGGGYL